MMLPDSARLLARLYALEPSAENAKALADELCASLPPLEDPPQGIPIKRNAIEVQTQTHLILLSFGKPVATIRKGGARAFQSQTDWSLTTRRHICAWLRSHGIEPKKTPKIPGAYIAELLS